MSVLVPSFTTNNHPHHHHSYFSNNTTRRINGNVSQTQQNRSTTGNTLIEPDQQNDHVPFGVVNSMKQRLLNKVNEAFVLNNNSSIVRHTLLKQSSRIASNENLLQTKSLTSPLKRTARLSRSQDNLTNNNNNNNNNNSINYLSGQSITTEQFTSYVQPKQDVIIVDTTKNSNHNEDIHDDGKLRAAQKTLAHRQSYTELHVDEAPKPGTVTTVKNMFERQIRLSRYDADKIMNTSMPSVCRLNSHHRDISSPIRSRSISPNDMAFRQRRTTIPGPILPLTSTTLSLTAASSYPDLVISHTPPTETNKISTEQIHIENHSSINIIPIVNKEKKLSNTNRNSVSHEHIPLSVVIDECSTNLVNNTRPNLLLPSKLVAETVDCQPLDFKSRLALFNRTNTERTNENSTSIKKPINSVSTNILTKPTVHHHTRPLYEEKKELLTEVNHNPLSIPISRSVVNTAKAVTFFGGNKINGNSTSSLPDTITPPPLPPSSSSQSSSSFEMNIKDEQGSPSNSIDLLQAPDIIGGDVKLAKSSIYSGTKKNIRVQFLDDVDTFEYPSYEVVMAEHVDDCSEDENNIEVIDERTNGNDTNDYNNNNHNINNNYTLGKKMNDKTDESIDKNNNVDDVDDDELERLAKINAEFNTNNLSEKPLKPKGTLHTFRPTHLDQYELGSQHGSLSMTKSSDIVSTSNSYTILARQKLLPPADTSAKTLSNHPILKQQKSAFDTTNTIQWSSMSTTTDLLF